MKTHLRAAITIFALLTLVTGVAYPLLVTLLAQGLFPFRANGSVIVRGGQAVGSELIGQAFDDARYFWGRPSATTKDGKDLPYHAGSSSGSNLGPTNPTLLKDVGDRVKAMREAHPDQSGAVPIDLVTTSASGLDPHITPAAVEYQVTRVAKSRGLSEDVVRQLVHKHIEPRTLGVLGEARVNVLRLNLALDALNAGG